MTLKIEPPQLDEKLCLATNIYFESRGEHLDGQFAVRDATLNRGGNICATVFAKKQFSWTAKIPWAKIEQFLHDKPRKLSERESQVWERCKLIAVSPIRILSFEYKHFHTLQVNPKWTKSGVVIGNHKFMKGVR